MASTANHSLGLAIKIPPDLKKALKFPISKDTIPISDTGLVKLVPLSRSSNTTTAHDELGEITNASANSEDFIGTKEVVSVEEAEVNSETMENTDDEGELDPLVEVSAPRALDEVSEHEKSSDYSDDESYAPPPSLPMAIVNITRLCGYVPNTDTERDAVAEEVLAALNEDDFDERLVELFEMNMARHGSTDEKITNEEFAVNYPEFLCPPDGRVISTSHVWKQFFREHKIKVVQRILNHLQRCNRSLVWKHDMREEICALAKREDQARKESELDQWRAQRRKLQLDKLYQVRETFHHRLEMARIKLEELEDEREEKVQVHDSGLQAFDLRSNFFAVDEHVKASDLLGMDQIFLERDDVEEDEGLDTNSSESSANDDDQKDQADDERSLGEELEDNNKSDDDAQTKPLEAKVITDTLPTRRRRRTNKKHRKLLKNAEEQLRQRQEIEAAMLEDKRVRDLFTTEELRKAETAVQSLEIRANQVDDLLESLQEDEWEDEEEGYKPALSANNENVAELSLLDQILAMILGSLPPIELVEQSEEHFLFISQEHKAILVAWRDYFGCLPTSRTSLEWERSDEGKNEACLDPFMSSDLRAELGIADNNGDWEDADDWELNSTTLSRGDGVIGDQQVVKDKQSTGLRPGGSLRPKCNPSM